MKRDTEEGNTQPLSPRQGRGEPEYSSDHFCNKGAPFSSSHGETGADNSLLFWAAAWSALLTFTVAVVTDFNASSGDLSGDASSDGPFFLGVCAGGLSVTLAVIGTWIALIHLPLSEKPARQHWRPRIMWGVVLVVILAALASALRKSPMTLAEILLTVMLCVMGPIVVWQWTQRRIYRRVTPNSQPRSIRKIMTLTVTVALAAAVLMYAKRLPEVSNALLLLVVSCAALWTIMLWAGLGWWLGMIGLLFPLTVAQGISLAVFMDVQGRYGEAENSQFHGHVIGFFLAALVFVMLMRSSGHRWIGAAASNGVRLDR